MSSGGAGTATATNTPAIDFVTARELGARVKCLVSEAKAGDPMAPVMVLVPNGSAGQSMARDLARNGGVVNVRFVTMERLCRAMLLEAGHEDQTFHTLTPDVRRELARLVAARARPPLDSRATPALVQALMEAFDDLRHRPALEVDSIADSSLLAAELVRLFGEYRALARRFSDSRDLIEAAEEAVGCTATPIVAVVASPPHAHESALLQRLSTARRLSTIALISGDPELDDALVFALNGLGSRGSRPASESRCSRIVVAPDADTEVQLAVGELMACAEKGTPFARMALLYTDTSPYLLIAHEQLRAAGVPSSGRSPLSLSQSVTGRFCLQLLDVLEDDFSVDSLNEWLTTSPVRETACTPVPGAEWMKVAREARIARGALQWRERASLYHRRLLGTDEEAAAAMSAAASFVADLSEWASSQRDGWPAWTLFMQEAIDRYLGDASERGGWPAHEARAALDVEQALLRLNRLGALGSTVDHQTFRAALTDELTARRARGRSAEGMFVGSIAEAVGCSFDTTILVGAAEGLLAGSTSERGYLGALRAPGQDRPADVERRHFLLALAASEEVIVSCPRVDQRRQREMRPSPWLLEQAGLLNGGPVSATALLDVEASRSWPWSKIVQSFDESLGLISIAPTAALDDLADLRRWVGSGRSLDQHPLVGAGSPLHRAVTVATSRGSNRLSRFDGIAGSGSLPADPISPTALEPWAVCPFRYFAASVLQIGEPVTEDDPFRTAGKERGTLVHAALEGFVRDAAPRLSPDQPWTSEERAELHRLAEALYEEARRDGRSPEGLLWDAELSVLHDNLDAFLDGDELARSRSAVMPSREGVEVPFGVDGRPPVVIEREGATPVTFRGRIDRVDRSVDGKRVVAIDYKTGKAISQRDLKEDPVAQGTKLQLAVYAQALIDAGSSSTSVRAGYWFVYDSEKQYPRVDIDYDDSTRARLEEVVTTVAEGIESGTFPAVPGAEDRDTYVNCRYCAYDAICPVERAEAWERKLGDSTAEVFHRLGAGR